MKLHMNNVPIILSVFAEKQCERHNKE